MPLLIRVFLALQRGTQRDQQDGSEYRQCQRARRAAAFLLDPGLQNARARARDFDHDGIPLDPLRYLDPFSSVDDRMIDPLVRSRVAGVRAVGLPVAGAPAARLRFSRARDAVVPPAPRKLHQRDSIVACQANRGVRRDVHAGVEPRKVFERHPREDDAGERAVGGIDSPAQGKCLRAIARRLRLVDVHPVVARVRRYRENIEALQAALGAAFVARAGAQPAVRAHQRRRGDERQARDPRVQARAHRLLAGRPAVRGYDPCRIVGQHDVDFLHQAFGLFRQCAAQRHLYVLVVEDHPAIILPRLVAVGRDDEHDQRHAGNGDPTAQRRRLAACRRNPRRFARRPGFHRKTLTVALNMYPAPRSVVSNVGFDGSASILRRRRRMVTSMDRSYTSRLCSRERSNS